MSAEERRGEPQSPDFHDKLDALRRIVETEHVPPGVMSALLGLSQRQKELFCWVGVPDAAVGAPRFLPGLYASDFFNELLFALKALDWPKVLILIHGNSSPDDLGEDYATIPAELPK